MKEKKRVILFFVILSVLITSSYSRSKRSYTPIDENFSKQTCRNSFFVFAESVENIKSIKQVSRTIIASSVTEPSNNPNEDRFIHSKLRGFSDGYFSAVFDGHGGYEVSDYASIVFLPYFEEAISKANSSGLNEYQIAIVVQEALKSTFSRVEKELFDLQLSKFQDGNYYAAYEGSCALVVVVLKTYVITANAGDSKARLFRIENGEILAKKLMSRHNCAKPKEKEALKQKFPNDKDIVKCNRGNICYVKGSLQVTRALGDFNLKHSLFNQRIKDFNGPYISSEPEVRILPYQRQTDYIIVASDGMWDELSTKDVSKILFDYSKKEESKEKLAKVLLEKSLSHVAEERRVTVDYIKRISPGQKKRRIHDDITIVALEPISSYK